MSRFHCAPSRRGHTWRELPLVSPSAGGPTIRELVQLRVCAKCKAVGRVSKQGVIAVVEAP
jgi:hypothetical protein